MEAIGIIVVILLLILGYSYLKAKRQEPKKGQTKDGPTPLPAIKKDPYQGIDIAENREQLIAWNAQNFIMNPNFIYPGPEGEDDRARHLRYSLFTPEQLRTVPVFPRTGIRRKRPYTGYVNGPFCMICDKPSAMRYKWTGGYHDCVHLCDACYRRYEADQREGWTGPDDFDKRANMRLWTIQQRIASSLQEKRISEATARAEMKEAEEATRQEMIRIHNEDAQYRAEFERERAKEAQLSDIVRDLTHK